MIPLNDLPAIITALGGLVAIIGGIVLAWRKAELARMAAVRSEEAAERAAAAAAAAAASIVIVGDKVMTVGEQLDGRLSELLREARATARAEGIAQGEQAQRDRQSKPLDER